MSDSLISSCFYDLYDGVGNRLRMTEANGHATTYSYDRAHRLLSELKKDAIEATIYNYQYDYHQVGNRTIKNIVNQSANFSYTYDSNNKLTSAKRGATTIASSCCDDNGNIDTRTEGNTTWDFDCDYENNITRARRNGSDVYTFRYDGENRRVERVGGPQGTVRFVYDGSKVIAETNGSNTLTVLYTPGICETRKQGAEWVTHWYHHDGLGNVRQLTDDLQRVSDAYNYDAWGNVVGKIGLSANPRRYVGKSGYYSDDDTGLMLLGVRYYDPLIGRFITPDPSRDGLNSCYAATLLRRVVLVRRTGSELLRRAVQTAEATTAAILCLSHRNTVNAGQPAHS